MITKIDYATALAAECPGGKRKLVLWDSHIKGLILEIRPSGSKTWAYRFVSPTGIQRQKKLCLFGHMSVEKVRKMAERLRAEIAINGGDPSATKQAAKQEPTYREFAVRHLAHVQTYQRSFATTKMYLEKHVIPRWGRLRMSEIHQADVALWLAVKSAEGLAPATVEKLRVLLGKSFSLALQWQVNGVTRNPTIGIKRPPINNARERYLNPAEALRLKRAVAASRNTQLKYIVPLLLLCGVRRGELLNAKWRHFDIERKTWLIPTSKTGKPRHVPLSQAAIDVIEQIPRFGDCPYLLPNPKTLKPFGDIKNAWQTARDAAMLPGCRIHDLRHSAASFMINAGIDLFAVGRILGHADHKSTMRYSHLANDTLLAAVEAGAKRQAVDWSAP